MKRKRCGVFQEADKGEKINYNIQFHTLYYLFTIINIYIVIFNINIIVV